MQRLPWKILPTMKGLDRGHRHPGSWCGLERRSQGQSLGECGEEWEDGADFSFYRKPQDEKKSQTLEVVSDLLKQETWAVKGWVRGTAVV